MPGLTQLLGFKFQQASEVCLHVVLRADAPQAGRVPTSLCDVAAILLGEGLVSLEELFPHLTPSDDDLEAAWKRRDASRNHLS